MLEEAIEAIEAIDRGRPPGGSVGVCLTLHLMPALDQNHAWSAGTATTGASSTRPSSVVSPIVV